VATSIPTIILRIAASLQSILRTAPTTPKSKRISDTRPFGATASFRTIHSRLWQRRQQAAQNLSLEINIEGSASRLVNLWIQSVENPGSDAAYSALSALPAETVVKRRAKRIAMQGAEVLPYAVVILQPGDLRKSCRPCRQAGY
jgi:hypothetical protein